MPTVAVIGSYRKHYDSVLAAIAAFKSAGWDVAHPAGSDIMVPGIDFVRFVTDPEHLDDTEVQANALRRIFSSDLTYVVAPGGYVGRTTCYEIGRVVQAKRPIYFSRALVDLPLRVPPQFVLTAEDLIHSLASGGQPNWLFDQGEGPLYDTERELGDFRSA